MTIAPLMDQVDAAVEPTADAAPGLGAGLLVSTSAASTWSEPRPLDEAAAGGGAAADHRRVHALVDEYMVFVWRSLRRLGVNEADCDDGSQRVWVVLAQKLGHVEEGKIRSYIFSIVVRVASEIRRTVKRDAFVDLDDDVHATGGADVEGLVDQKRMRVVLDELLMTLSWDLRTVFVMFELEGLSSPEIAEALGLHRGTVASRLRLAREAFQRALLRYQARLDNPRPIRAASPAVTTMRREP